MKRNIILAVKIIGVLAAAILLGGFSILPSGICVFIGVSLVFVILNQEIAARKKEEYLETTDNGDMVLRPGFFMVFGGITSIIGFGFFFFIAVMVFLTSQSVKLIAYLCLGFSGVFLLSGVYLIIYYNTTRIYYNENGLIIKMCFKQDLVCSWGEVISFTGNKIITKKGNIAVDYNTWKGTEAFKNYYYIQVYSTKK